MRWVEQFQLVLLDFDGLLVDTEPLHFAAYRELCQRYGCELSWSFDAYCFAAHAKSQGMKDALYAEFPDLSRQQPKWEVLYQEKKEIYLRMLQEGRLALMPGAEALLKKLQASETKHCVVTNSFREQIDLIKKTLPVLQQIPVWFTREDYPSPKPAPDGYIKAMSLLAKQGDRIIGFEDSLKGLHALLGAGALGVLICSATHPQVAECRKLGVPHFESLLDVSIPQNQFSKK